MSAIIFNSETISANQACIKHNDRGFTLGHGLFETILVNKEAIPALEYHWRRLETSAPLIGISIPFSKEELEQMIKQLIQKNDLSQTVAAARLTLTHGESERGILPVNSPKPNFVISVFEYNHIPKENYSALIVNTRKNEHSLSSRIKSISYLDNILAKQEAMQQGYDEAILLNSVSNVADGAITNVFMVKDGQIHTPTIADGALPGVIRHILLEEFKSEFSIIERAITVSELLTADEVFLTNALMGVQLVKKLNLKMYEDVSISRKVAQSLSRSKYYATI